MTTDTNLARLYRETCADDASLLATVNPSDLIDLAQGRLAGERRAQLIELIAASPTVASAYRMAKASGAWAQSVAADMSSQQQQKVATGFRHSSSPRRPVVAIRRPFAIAAAVGAMAVGALFVSQHLSSPSSGIDADFASADVAIGTQGDAILAVTFGNEQDADTIFSARTSSDSDKIFAFGKGS